jgi:hypothetical protein
MSKFVLPALSWAGILIVSAVLLKFAQGNHLIGTDAAARVFQVLLGLTIAANANLMTKEPMNPPPTERGGRMQAARRVTARAMFIAGLAYAAAAALAPHPFDVVLAMAAVGTAAVVSIGNAIRTLGGLKAK